MIQISICNWPPFLFQPVPHRNGSTLFRLIYNDQEHGMQGKKKEEIMFFYFIIHKFADTTARGGLYLKPTKL